jgi:hypothetical protein
MRIIIGTKANRKETRMKICNKVFRGSPGILVPAEAGPCDIHHCTFISFEGRKRIPIEDLIRADGREPGGGIPWGRLSVRRKA